MRGTGVYRKAIAEGLRSASGQGSRHRGVLAKTSDALALSLYSKYKGNLKRLAEKVYDPRTSCGVDDLVQEGFMGLLEAWHVFDEALSGNPSDISFWPYAYGRIRGSMVDELRRTSNFSRRDRDLFHMEQYESYKHGETEYEPTEDKRVKFIAWLDELPNGQARQMITLYVLKGLSMLMVGAAYGVSESRACQVIRKTAFDFRGVTQ